MAIGECELAPKYQTFSVFVSKLWTCPILQTCIHRTFLASKTVNACWILGILLLLVHTSYKIFSSQTFQQIYAIFWKTDEQVVWQKLLEYLSYSGLTFGQVKVAFFRFVIVEQPEDIQIVLSSSLKKSNFYRLFENAVGDGLFTAAVFNFKTKMLISRLSDKSDTGISFDLWKHVFLHSLSLICETMMNFRICPNDKVGEEFEKALLKVTEADAMRIYKIWLQPEIIFNFFAYLTEICKYFESLRKLSNEILKKGKVEYEKEKISQEDGGGAEGFFLKTLFHHRDNGFKFSDQDISDEIMTMLIGGSEASALTLCFTLLMLGMHPEIQENVYKEIEEIVNEGNQFIDLEHVHRMSYLEQCIKETLRLFPVGPLLLRETTKKITLSNNSVIPAGKNIIIPVIKVHRDARIFSNPLKWNPDNFSVEEVSKRHKCTFLGFSAGPRGCIGSTYALWATKVTLSLLLFHYKIMTDIKMEDIKLKVDLMLRSASGFPVKLYRRV